MPEAGSPGVVADRLHSAAIHLLRRLRRQDDASGLSAPRLSALSVIVFGGPLTIGALAAAEQVQPPTMTRIVTALEQDGLAVREPSAEDGRVVHVRATRAGERLLQQGRLRRTRALANELAALPPEDLAALSRASLILEELVRSPKPEV